MKKIFTLLVFTLIPFFSNAQTGLPGEVKSSGTYFNNDELKIQWEMRQDAWNPGEQAYEKASLRFINKTNNRIRVKYKVQAYLVRYGKTFEYENTLFVAPNSNQWEEVISHHRNLHDEHETIVNIRSFNLINYAVEPVSYKTAW